jgi:hypothetical protein
MCTIDSCHKGEGCVFTYIADCESEKHSRIVVDLNSEDGTADRPVSDIDLSSFGTSGPTLSVGAIVGIVVGVVFAVGLIAVLFVKARATSSSPSDDSYQKMN